MTKRPAFMFYPGDWLKDPALRRCSPATRGIWVDWICAMHELDECGQLRGTVVQLARLAGCTEDECESALHELSVTGTGDVDGLEAIQDDCHAEVTVTNRRMHRAFEERVAARERKQNQRNKGAGVPQDDDRSGAGDRVRPANSHAGVPEKSHLLSSSSSSISSSDRESTVTPADNAELEIPGFEGTDDALAFADWFKALLPPAHNLPRNWRESWAAVYRELVRIDKRPPEEIRRVCEWARNDSFWTTNFYSPAKLRKRNTQQVLYYDVFLDKCTSSANGAPTKSRVAKPDYQKGWAKR